MSSRNNNMHVIPRYQVGKQSPLQFRIPPETRDGNNNESAMLPIEVANKEINRDYPTLSIPHPVNPVLITSSHMGNRAKSTLENVPIIDQLGQICQAFFKLVNTLKSKYILPQIVVGKFCGQSEIFCHTSQSAFSYSHIPHWKSLPVSQYFRTNNTNDFQVIY